MHYIDRVWVACAPPGIVSSGPAVIFGFEDGIVQQYRDMGWNVSGPYGLIESVERMFHDLKPWERNMTGLFSGAEAAALVHRHFAIDDEPKAGKIHTSTRSKEVS